MKPIYINSSACISPQATFDNEDFLSGQSFLKESPRRCIEPIFKDYINPRLLRRMGRMVRMGVCAASKALDDAKVDNPEAILVGTGMGCLKDTEEFLTSIYNSDENIASPNQFIQSTHNNVAAQIAIMLHCYNYNFTYVHRGFSFESAMMDAMLHLNEAEDQPTNILVGASDELTDMYLKVTSKLNFWKPRHAISRSPSDFVDGSEQGEGAAFFTVSNKKKENAIARIDGLQMIYKPQSKEELSSSLKRFLASCQITIQDLDIVLLGFDGGNDETSVFRQVVNEELQEVPHAMFKHLCGEYKTAGAFDTWLAGELLRKQMVPDFVKMSSFETDRISKVLLFNNYNNANYTLSLLSHV